MRRAIVPLFLFIWTSALAVLTVQSFLPTNNVAAQAPKGRPHWEYASLVMEDTAMGLHWHAGETALTSAGNATKPDPSRSIKDLYQQMGGKDEKPTLGTLLNLIGLGGWELVSYIHPSGAQVWMFKRQRV